MAKGSHDLEVDADEVVASRALELHRRLGRGHQPRSAHPHRALADRLELAVGQLDRARLADAPDSGLDAHPPPGR